MGWPAMALASGRAPGLARLFPLGPSAAAMGASQLSIAAAGEPCGRHIEDTSQYEPRIPQHQVPEEPFPRRWVIDDPRHVQDIRDQAEATIQAEADTANPGGSQHHPMDPAVLPGAHEGERQQTTADLEDAGGQVGDEPHRPARCRWLLERLEAGTAPGGPEEAQGGEEESPTTSCCGRPPCPPKGRRLLLDARCRRHVTPRAPAPPSPSSAWSSTQPCPSNDNSMVRHGINTRPVRKQGAATALTISAEHYLLLHMPCMPCACACQVHHCR